MSKSRRRISTQYCVETGRASWHQQRAGHISSGSTCFWSKKQAKKYMRGFKKHHPDEPAFIRSERKLRHFGGR
jgi:hypothetical protein